MKKLLTQAVILLILTLPFSLCFCDIGLPNIIGSNMVVQQNSDVSIWGWAQPGEKVRVVPGWGFLNMGTGTFADNEGKWMVKLRTPAAGGPYSIVIRGENRIKLENVMVGEVWICSGQSNMEWPIRRINNYANVIDEADDYPDIHFFNVNKHVSSDKPMRNCPGEWSESNTDALKNFSAVGYMFARELNKKLNVPIGIIGTNWGGTMAEAWMSQEALEKDDEFSVILKRMAKRDNERGPTKLYNGMLSPIIPYGIQGVIWYQGEANRGRAYQYRKLFPALIENWREDFGQGDFPFYYVQIAPYKYKDADKTNGAELREAQLMTLSVPDTGMAVTMDIGNIEDIHPKNKLDVAKRLAFWALVKEYGFDDIVYSGPVYKCMSKEDGKIRIYFDYTGEGLTVKGGKLRHFEIAGEDRHFKAAQAKIESDTVVVWSDEVEDPAAVRYAFKNGLEPESNLYNSASLPASSFRTDDWHGETYGVK